MNDQATTRPAASSPLIKAAPLTWLDHLVNIFKLVIKELRSIRADPTMLVLVLWIRNKPMLRPLLLALSALLSAYFTIAWVNAKFFVV